MKFEKVIVFLGAFVLVILVLFSIYGFFLSDLFYSSYVGIKHSCYEITDEELLNKGYYVAGNTTSTYVNGTQKIGVVLVDKSEKVRKHELIHTEQYLSNRVWGCNNKPFLFINELEAKVMSNLDSRTLNFIYRTDRF